MPSPRSNLLRAVLPLFSNIVTYGQSSTSRTQSVVLMIGLANYG